MTKNTFYSAGHGHFLVLAATLPAADKAYLITELRPAAATAWS